MSAATMTALGAVSLTILIVMAAGYGHIFRVYRQRFFLFMTLAWLANAGYITFEAFGPGETTVGTIIAVSFVSLPTTFFFYFAWATLRYGGEEIPFRKLWGLYVGTVLVLATLAIVPFLGLDLATSFVAIVTPVAAFTGVVLLLLSRAIGRLDEREMLALLRGTLGATNPAHAGNSVTLKLSSSTDEVLTLGEILSRSIPADALPKPIVQALRLARTLLAWTLAIYALLQIAYPVMGPQPGTHPLFAAIAFWTAFAVKLTHGAGVVTLLVADLRQVEDVLRRKSVAEELGALNMSIEHDINNPLGNLRREMQTLEKEYQHESGVQKRIALMKRQVERIRVAAAVIPAMREGVDVYKAHAHSQNVVWIVREAADAVKRMCNVSDLQILFEASSSDIRITAYPERLQQAFVNVLNNGVEACLLRPSAGPPLIRVSCSKGRDGRVLVVIRDRGAGIPSDILPRITAPMFSTKSDGTGNRGIGLFIAARIIGYHHGDLQFTSDGSTYTEVSARFPIAT